MSTGSGATGPAGPEAAAAVAAVEDAGEHARFRVSVLFVLLAVGVLAVAAPFLLQDSPTAKPATAPRAASAPRPQPSATPAPEGVRIDLAQAKELFDVGAAVFVDVRDLSDYHEGHIPGAMSIPLDDILRRHGEIPRRAPVLTYCSCSDEETSMKAVEKLREAGFDEVKALRGGLPAWKSAGFEIVTEPR